MVVCYTDSKIEAIGYDLAADRLQRIAALSIPAFVIHNAGDSLEECIENLGPAMAESGFKLGNPNAGIGYFPFSYDTIPRVEEGGQQLEPGVSYEHLGLHMDSARDSSLSPLTTVALHYTEIGACEASLFEPTDAFLDYHHGYLPDGTQGLFVEGFVDDEVLKPVRYVAKLHPKSLMPFRLGGKTPLAHNFNSLSLPRRSFTQDILHHAKRKQLSYS